MEHIRIVAKVPRFRRAGRLWTDDGVVVDAADFSAEELEALRADPMLVVAPHVPERAVPTAEGRREDLLAAARQLRAFRGADGPPSPALLGQVAGAAEVTDAERDAAWEIAALERRHRPGADPERGSEARSGEPRPVGADPAAGSERHHAIIAAVDRLDPAQADHWTGTGKPRLDALRLAGAPEDLTPEERDRAWADVRP